MKILVADDDPSFVAVQAALLRRHGYTVLTCTEGADVMPLVEESRPDVLLLDLSMPGMNGFDVALELKENPDLRPRLLIAVTGHRDPGAATMTERAGFDFHLVKPVNYSVLTALLDSMLQAV
jgi:two-component system, chemotaxis family, CheB/CheR fusion protein